VQRHMTCGFLVGGLLLIAAASVSAQNWGRPRVPPIGACFYEDVNFEGRYFCSRVGATNAEVPPGTNDRISSIRIFGNAEVIVFRDRGFDGRSRRFDSDMADLRQAGWNDRISSLRVATTESNHDGNWGGNWGRPPAPSSGVCFYQDIHFGGEYFCARVGAATANVPRGTNDRISSVRVFGNASVTVFRDSDFDGQSRRFDSDMSDLRGAGWNDRISSFRVGQRGAGGRGNRGGGQGQGEGGRRDSVGDVISQGQILRGVHPEHSEGLRMTRSKAVGSYVAAG